MRKKIRAVLLSLLMLATGFCLAAGLAACGGETTYAGVSVVFELEGGTYKNSTHAIRYYYDVAEGSSALLRTPAEFDPRNTITRVGYHVARWCRTRTVDEAGNVSYDDAWDFATDRITSESGQITLYADWQPDIVYAYDLCYRETDGTVKVLWTYEVNAGDPFSDRRNKADTRDGYTAERVKGEDGTLAVRFYDEADEPWDPNFKHPGGEESTTVRVFAHYLEGEFDYVTTAAELERAIGRNRGVYLCNDIDMKGADFDGIRNSSGTFRSVFYGNGYTVSNFNLAIPVSRSDLSSDPELGNNLWVVTLFGNLSGATVKDVTFENFTVTLDQKFSGIQGIYVAPVALRAENSELSGVTVNGTVTIKALPDGFDEENDFVKVEARAFYAEGEGVTVDGTCSFRLTFEDARS